MENTWFETWFDSPYYPVLYSHRNEAEAEAFIQKLLTELHPGPGAHFLDLACGRGRHARYIHGFGHDVTGIDLSPASIADANKYAEDGIRFKVQDMRDPFPGTYDFILNLFTSFGYFERKEDNLRVLKNVAMSLRSSGVFVLDFLNANKVIAGLVPSEDKVIDGLEFGIRRSVEDGNIVKRIHVNDQGVHQDYMEKVQALTYSDLVSMMIEAGLTPYNMWGDYSGGRFSPENSDRLILFARLA